ncbi:diacylglycerol/lipid kinase family protein [Tepidimicrobium xylanilyticum]|uniref:Diacylglycerol kinase (ATP) n=1 Tax=Tepidimicrobium xylanilyticum TaxID=1123352 RepID=A0A1H3A8C9_9FIRM|nr:YegS/Rv2252/BmrU family lipid kinase [Tepidimicrobium xylanilyticum]GMG96284.1 diacylglycerol kinase [Tepidimicrobium xylanilyticum]SDX25990.1 diacylglycerol kinase (ATP) [Tepidimicrobium xylanilyticum]
MEKVKIICNPSSGRQIIQKRVDYLCNLLINDGYVVGKFNTKTKDDAMDETIKTCSEDWDLIVVCGGDGTVNEVAKGIAKSNRKVPVAILSAGTVNDFATYMDLPKNIDDFFTMIKNRKTKIVDLGRVNDEYFINVAAGGLLTNVAYQVPPEAKAIFGRMAYYIEGLKEIPKQKFKPIRARFESEEYSEEEDVLLFLISNSASIGGFKRLAPDANVSDGYLDVVIIKKSEVQDLAQIFINIFRGEHVYHPNVVYFKSKRIWIDAEEDVIIDIDGECGGKLPAVFEVVPEGFEIIVPS